MKVYINRIEALRQIEWYMSMKERNYGNRTITFDEVVGLILDLDVADVVEVKHGEWYISEYEYFNCSECGNSVYNGCDSTAEAKSRLNDGMYNNYCPNCGAKMDGGKSDDR